MSLEDREWLLSLPKEKLVDLLLLQIRNIWRVDGFYFLGIERRFGTEAATEIDVECWKNMARREARDLVKLLEIKGSGVKEVIEALRATSWAIYQEGKEIEIHEDRAVLRIRSCRTQKARLKAGLEEFPCKRVRWTYLQEFAKEINPDIEVICRVCPPDKHPPDLWCEWEFVLKRK
ncbi:MAG: DUF6125 family protein [Candidatus Baldrarchaeia archaeon]